MNARLTRVHASTPLESISFLTISAWLAASCAVHKAALSIPSRTVVRWVHALLSSITYHAVAFPAKDRVPHLVHDRVDDASHGEDTANNGAERGQKAGECGALLGELDHDRRDIIDDEDAGEDEALRRIVSRLELVGHRVLARVDHFPISTCICRRNHLGKVLEYARAITQYCFRAVERVHAIWVVDPKRERMDDVANVVFMRVERFELVDELALR
mmetsp:Transcript_31040/g.81189  ORF Transcript_31040/g.81189 Transcript_31040/m.81189 type:complete len:216 (-) Transcript_31040:790-1437(-)